MMDHVLRFCYPTVDITASNQIFGNCKIVSAFRSGYDIFALQSVGRSRTSKYSGKQGIMGDPLTGKDK